MKFRKFIEYDKQLHFFSGGFGVYFFFVIFNEMTLTGMRKGDFFWLLFPVFVINAVFIVREFYMDRKGSSPFDILDLYMTCAGTVVAAGSIYFML